MVEEVRPNLFRVKIPLPDSPLRFLNSYIIISTKRNLIIDTGLNRQECFEAMKSALKELKVKLEVTDFFITHLHADHFGLLSKLVTESSKVYFNRPDAEIIESWEGFETMIAYAGRSGFPEGKLRSALTQHPGYKFGSDWVPKLNILKDGDHIDIGEYHFQCIETPGHTLGHTCLYEPDKKILVSGDHVLQDISPNIQCWSDDENPLKSYLKSLEKVFELDADLVLPGHRRLFNDHRQRIRELQTHHSRRLTEIQDILSNSPISAYETASQMTWDIRADSWKAFPLMQQWFATGEAISHLRYLEEKRMIRRKMADNMVKFLIPSDRSLTQIIKNEPTLRNTG
ncbi:MBL fold metallo-hydrolase [Desulfosarcina ovata]|uniref:MBL fold metallo-hydrolase n=1 Tax=Desulfosarcina ovata subsp. ovata TaxID=2752305 RepID=A0A5K8A6N0_9BACT|nr:MBL fold metallo-hydrolase [Desulfosarcina ovata]BBO88129.1 MBL fold metallo-hydrolase [Desulfosarcina ovata subsp. ovata]